MAKCVRLVGQGVPYRFHDEDAFQIVERDKDGEYWSKAAFKEHWAKPGAVEYLAANPKVVINQAAANPTRYDKPSQKGW